MTDLDLLLQALAEHPDDDALALALTDELMDTPGYSPALAAARVAAERELAHQARSIAEATHLMRSDTDSGRYLRSIIARTLRSRLDLPLSTIVVYGYQGPHGFSFGANEPHRRLASRYRGQALVGSEWIRARWADRLVELARRAQQLQDGPRRRR
jgi:hypothetical protein